jgi:sulfonate transport system permease protein
MTLPASTTQAGAPHAERPDAPASPTLAAGTMPVPAPARRWGTGGIVGFMLPFALALVWEASVRLGFSNGRLMPPPSRIGATLWDLAQTGELASHAGATLWRVAAGFGLGAAAGTVLGAVSGASPVMRRIMDPTLQALRAIPSIAWVPLFILWLGIFEASKVALIAVGVFFPVYLGVAAALSGVDRKIIEVGRVFRLSRLQMIRRVTLPAILPAWITALRTGLGLGFMFVVAAEFMGASEGLGYLLVDGQQLGRPDRILAAIIAFAVLGKIADGLLVVVTRPLLIWQDVGRDRL